MKLKGTQPRGAQLRKMKATLEEGTTSFQAMLTHLAVFVPHDSARNEEFFEVVDNEYYGTPLLFLLEQLIEVITSYFCCKKWIGYFCENELFFNFEASSTPRQ